MSNLPLYRSTDTVADRGDDMQALLAAMVRHNYRCMRCGRNGVRRESTPTECDCGAALVVWVAGQPFPLHQWHGPMRKHRESTAKRLADTKARYKSRKKVKVAIKATINIFEQGFDALPD